LEGYIKMRDLKYTKNFKVSIFKALNGAILFSAIYFFSNIEFIRENFDDLAFDLTDKFYLSYQETSTKSPNIHLFMVDGKYLKNEHLLNENNETNYGYLFPRSKIADFIDKLDEYLATKKSVHPKVLFIDYDFSFTSIVGNKSLSNEDIVFIETLKRARDYVIILPKTSHFNFIEHSMDIELQKIIKNKKIIFSSVGLTVSSDFVSRRYCPSKEYASKTYLGVSAIIYNLTRELNITQEEINVDDIIKNRIIYKKYREIGSSSEYNISLSCWNSLRKYSANYPLDFIIDEKLNGSVIMFGSAHKGNNDSFNNNSILGVTDVYGLDIHANALMTLYSNEGKINKSNFFFSSFLVLFLFFLLNFSLATLFEFFALSKYTKLEFVLSLVITTLVMFSISIYLLQQYSIWFNWIAPLALFEFFEFLELLKIFSLFNTIKKIKGKI